MGLPCQLVLDGLVLEFRAIAELKFPRLVLELELAGMKNHLEQNVKIIFLLGIEGGERRILLARMWDQQC